MIEDYEDTVDTKSWSDEELDEKIQTLEQSKAQLESQVSRLNQMVKALSQKDNGELLQKMGQGINKSIKASNDSIDTLNDQINHFKEIKQHLHEFDAKSSSFMTDAQSLISMATKGINEINNGLNPKTGESILPDDSQLTWIDDVNEKASKYDSRKEQFIDMMSDTYGLDDETAEDLYKLQQGIEKYAKKHHRSGEWAVYEFNRIIASLGGYGSEGTEEGSPSWAQTGCMAIDDAKSLFKEYTGLSKNDINRLRKHLTDQHTNDGSKKSDLAHESVIISSHFTHAYQDADPLQALFNIMDIGITRTGGIMVNNSGVSSGFDDNVSYRGDIKSGIQGTSDRDLESDVDADNITARVKKTKNVNQALNVMTDYHSGIAEGSVDRKKRIFKKSRWLGIS